MICERHICDRCGSEGDLVELDCDLDLCSACLDAFRAWLVKPPEAEPFEVIYRVNSDCRRQLRLRGLSESAVLLTAHVPEITYPDTTGSGACDAIGVGASSRSWTSRLGRSRRRTSRTT